MADEKVLSAILPKQQPAAIVAVLDQHNFLEDEMTQMMSDGVWLLRTLHLMDHSISINYESIAQERGWKSDSVRTRIDRISKKYGLNMFATKLEVKDTKRPRATPTKKRTAKSETTTKTKSAKTKSVKNETAESVKETAEPAKETAESVKHEIAKSIKEMEDVFEETNESVEESAGRIRKKRNLQSLLGKKRVQGTGRAGRYGWFPGFESPDAEEYGDVQDQNEASTEKEVKVVGAGLVMGNGEDSNVQDETEGEDTNDGDDDDDFGGDAMGDEEFEEARARGWLDELDHDVDEHQAKKHKQG